MGWASGSSLMDDLVRAAKKHIPDEKARGAFYLAAIRAFEREDCDTLDECMGHDPVFDAAMRKANPGLYDESESE